MPAGPVSASLPNSLELTPARCSSAALSSRTRSPPKSQAGADEVIEFATNRGQCLSLNFPACWLAVGHVLPAADNLRRSYALLSSRLDRRVPPRSFAPLRPDRANAWNCRGENRASATDYAIWLITAFPATVIAPVRPTSSRAGPLDRLRRSVPGR